MYSRQQTRHFLRQAFERLTGKNELLDQEHKKNEEVTDELEYLLNLSKDLEEDDQLHAVMTLAEREQEIVGNIKNVQ